MSFLKVVHPLKYPNNACLSFLDNGKECNLFRVSKCHRCLTSEQVSYQNNTQIPLKYQSILHMPLSKYGKDSTSVRASCEKKWWPRI